MSFADLEFNTKSNFQKVARLFLTPGQHQIRIIDNEPYIEETHYVMGKYTVVCPGEGCPVCANNKKIILENPDNFRDVSGYSGKRKVYIFNVLDRSQVKVCPKCSNENKMIGNNYSATCSQCNEFISSVAPSVSNKVKLITCGVKLATALAGVEKAVLDVNRNRVGLKNFDLVLAVEGTGRNQTVLPIPATSNNDVLPDLTEQLNDPKQATMVLTSAEILSLLRGISLKDIFNARRPAPSALETKEDELAGAVGQDTLAGLEADLEGMFANKV